MVATPEQEQLQTSLWLVSGSIDNALDTKGIRCKLYRLVGERLGYYDPVRRVGGKDIAFWYEDKSLRFHVQK
ncbi:hypothetical protein PI124_g16294 [Phytophthora idaei]|nr:hypothetical protein PI125_g14838 [Phytophthora idaei]KAG3238756.1 hypothetical protein PI124_g16294 [Phytophthora idaei]